MKKVNIMVAALCVAGILTGCGNTSQSTEIVNENTFNEETSTSLSEGENSSETEDVTTSDLDETTNADDSSNSPEIAFTSMDYDESESEETKVKNKVQKYIDDNYTYTEIDRISINDDLGTDEDGDYIALVYLTWNQKNSGDLSKEMLNMYSSDMAARMYDDLPEIQELAVFWTVPYLNNGSAKISFERKDGGMQYTDTMFDSNFD